MIANMINFNLGEVSKRVEEIQKRLDISIDGIFGPNTLKAVKQFQKENDLVVDGIVGKNTWKELLKEEENIIKPISKSCFEDEDDPDEEMLVDTDKEEEAPVSPYISELVNLIDSVEIERNVKRLIFHCTATSQDATVSAIQNYWENNLGWNNPGYHIMVKPDGSWTYLLDFNEISNGVRGYNSTSINVSYIGGIDENGDAIDNRTSQQIEVFDLIYEMLNEKIDNLSTHGHNEFSSKSCPCYIVKDDLEKRNLA